jgi:hypothetical protein
VDLSGDGNLISVLLEALPRWGRLMLAASKPQPFTTAFYTDIHRKGTVVCADDRVEAAFADPAGCALEIRNARRLVSDSGRRAQLNACLRNEAIAANSGAAGV